MSRPRSGWPIVCPLCDYCGLFDEFEMSLADEMFCPKCDEKFIYEGEADDDD